MPTTSSKSHRRGHEENGRTGKLAGRSASFHCRIHAMPDEIRRLKSHPDLLSGEVPRMSPETPARLTKLLLNVTIQRSLGAVQVVISPESTVGDLIAATVRLYAKEGRRPFLPTTDPLGFDLHYSQFSFESLNQEEKLITLGSRNFFLCPNKTIEVAVVKSSSSSSSSSSCSNQVEKASKAAAFPWFSFLDFLL